MRKHVNAEQAGAVISGLIVQDEDASFYRWFGVDCTCPRDIVAMLSAAGNQPVVFGIDSPGGSMTAAAAIYEACMAYNGAITFEITCASSAASLLSMASAKQGNTSRISPLGTMFIHNAQTGAEGDYREMEKTRNILLSANQVVVNAYKLKTGLDETKIRDLLDNDTMLAPQEALALGLVDEIMHQGGENKVDFSNEQLQMIKGQTRSLLNLMPTPSRQAIRQFYEQHPINAAAQPPAEPDAASGVTNEDDFDIEQARALLEIEEARY